MHFFKKRSWRGAYFVVAVKVFIGLDIFDAVFSLFFVYHIRTFRSDIKTPATKNYARFIHHVHLMPYNSVEIFVFNPDTARIFHKGHTQQAGCSLVLKNFNSIPYNRHSGQTLRQKSESIFFSQISKTVSLNPLVRTYDFKSI